jgi:hypothetical protein
MGYRHGLRDNPVLGTNKGSEARPGVRGMAPVEEGVLPKWFGNLSECVRWASKSPRKRFLDVSGLSFK